MNTTPNDDLTNDDLTRLIRKADWDMPSAGLADRICARAAAPALEALPPHPPEPFVIREMTLYAGLLSLCCVLILGIFSGAFLGAPALARDDTLSGATLYEPLTTIYFKQNHSFNQSN